MSRDFDSPWKDTLDDFLEEFCREFAPATHAVMDWAAGVENLETELPKLLREGEMGLVVADRLYRVRERDTAEPICLLIHAEVQNQRDEDLPHRMFTYHHRIKDAYGRHPIGIAVLGDPSPAWRPTHYEWRQGGARLRYDFVTVKLWDWQDRAEDLEAMPGFIGAAVLAHLQSFLTNHDDASRYAWKRRLMILLYNKGYDGEAARRVFRIIDWFLALPPGMEQQLTKWAYEYERENAMPYVWSRERFAREDGVLEGQRRSAVLALRAKFKEAGQQFADTELASADSDTLDKVIPALFNVNTLDELRAAISS